MAIFLADQALWVVIVALIITGFAGFVKGAVGFAMPLIMISTFSSLLPPEIALAGLILPTVITNIWQAFRQGIPAAWETAKKYHRFLIGMMALIPLSAQWVRIIPQDAFLLLLGVPIAVFAGLQLAGRSLAIRLEHRNRAEWGLGIIAGLYGGVAGVWGPPLLVFLLSTQSGKQETVRAQGVVFLIGALVLLGAHLHSGVLNAKTLPFSAILVVPALLGMVLGYWIQDRIAQARFRRWTQILLVLTGLNLIRQALVL